MSNHRSISAIVTQIEQLRNHPPRFNDDSHDALLLRLADESATTSSDVEAKLKEFAWLYWGGTLETDLTTTEDKLLSSILSDINNLIATEAG